MTKGPPPSEVETGIVNATHDLAQISRYGCAIGAPGTDGWLTFAQEIAIAGGVAAATETADLYQALNSEGGPIGFRRDGSMVIWLYAVYMTTNTASLFLNAFAGINRNLPQLPAALNAQSAQVVYAASSLNTGNLGTGNPVATLTANAKWGSDTFAIIPLALGVDFPFPVFDPAEVLFSVETNAGGVYNGHINWVLRVLPAGVNPRG